MSHLLDPLCLPLWGSRLIEASAGTGKTWTIAALYLRLVLGPPPDAVPHGQGEAVDFGRALAPEEILVMTFTRAATRELTERVRTRLVQAAECFGQTQRLATHAEPWDAFLLAMRERYPQGPAREQATYRLTQAAAAMDGAAIHTLDSWCQRMLREHPFDGAGLAEEELVPNENEIIQQAAHDYWRQQVYPLSPEDLLDLMQVWPSPEHLFDEARDWSRYWAHPEQASAPLAATITTARAHYQQQMAGLRKGWQQGAADMRTWLDAQTSVYKDQWDGRRLKPSNYQGWLEQLVQWAQASDDSPLALSTSAWARLAPSGLAEARKAGAPAIDVPAAFEAFAQLQKALTALPHWHWQVRAHALQHLGQRVAQLKQQSGRFGFADLLTRFNAALSGPNGSSMRARVRQQFPVAMVDEFQDTSLLQYRVLDQVYAVHESHHDSALLLIGDPKQSIYRFRGADIDSYLRARRTLKDRLYVLGTNHRSSTQVVNAVNHLFARAEQHTTRGAFALAASNEAENPLPFESVRAKGRDDALTVQGQPVPAWEIYYTTAVQSATDVQQQFAPLCAEQIVRWLNDSSARFVNTSGTSRPLRPADIAVLVRSAREAAVVRSALQQRGVASVYLSDRDSVFASPEAWDVWLWLKAVAAPRDAQALRAGFATDWMGATTAQMRQLALSDEALEQRMEQVNRLRQVWHTQGVLAMLRQTLHQLDLPARWLAKPEGERRLTNTLHLADLLQNASVQARGETALIRWLAAQIQHPEDTLGSTSDDPLVRLESDADLVQVMTVHKSKGLEFPVVCLPFACAFRKSPPAPKWMATTDEAGEGVLNFVVTPEQAEQADAARLQEDIRLLYVALTRAQHAIWMGFSALRVGNSTADQTHECALGYLLGGQASKTPTDWAQHLRDLAQNQEGVCQTEAPEYSPLTLLLTQAQATPLATAPPYNAAFERDWSIASFSAMAKGVGAALPAGGWDPLTRLAEDVVVGAEARLGGQNGREGQEGQDEWDGATTTDLQQGPETALTNATHQPQPQPALDAPWHRIKKGPITGNFLHDQLEWLAAEGFDASPARLLARCERAGNGLRGSVSTAAQDLCLWLQTIVQTPLPPLQASLQHIGNGLAEMEFWLPWSAMDVEQVDSLCRNHVFPGQARPALPARRLRGLMMGFADWVFEHQGQYWVLDYKSNALGNSGQDYHSSALVGAVLGHRYDVQAALYQLALHRLLLQRLGKAYDPAVHLGGALFYFVRGLDGPHHGVLHIPPSVPLLQTLDAWIDASEGAV